MATTKAKAKTRAKQTMTVSQHMNARWAGTDSDTEFIFKVESAVNFLDVAVGKWLSRQEVESWINFGVQVNILPTK